MKKRIYMITFILMLGLCTGCSKEEKEKNEQITENEIVNIIEDIDDVDDEKIDGEENEIANDVGKTDSVVEESNHSEENDTLEVDFTKDYSEDIKADVDDVVLNAVSLQRELEEIEKLILKYTPLAEEAQTQGEMNLSSKWLFQIGDTELNNLWSRFSDLAEQQTKERVLTEQRNWVSMKEEVTLLSIGSREENGSMYPLLENSFLEEITKNRVYILASELAKVKGESFEMPEISSKYGLFVDNQGTGSVYSYLNMKQGMEENDEAVISVYKQGEIEGSFIENEDGKLAFTADNGSVKGIIEISGWDGASFEVTEILDGSMFSVGEIVKFPFVF